MWPCVCRRSVLTRPTVTDAPAEGSGELPELVFLHTACVHVQTFDGLLRELRPKTRARHVVREDLLAQAQRSGSDALQLLQAVTEAVLALEAGPDAVVLCTCSTIGGLAESAAASTGVRVIRVDRPMAERAVATGPNVLVAVALESTLLPTETLILEAASRVGVPVRISRLVIKDAWPLFQQGNFDAYLSLIGEALKSVKDCDVIVLAQASMAGAADLCRSLRVPVLSSPRLGLEFALEVMDTKKAQIRADSKDLARTGEKSGLSFSPAGRRSKKLNMHGKQRK